MSRFAISTVYILLFSFIFQISYTFELRAADKAYSNISFEDAEGLPESNLDLYLLSTITGSESNSKAILKNPTNGRANSYKVGEYIYLHGLNSVRLVKIFPCMSVIESGRKYLKMYCKSSEINNDHFKPQALLEYKVENPRHAFTTNAYNTDFDKQILYACTKYDVDPNLIKAIIKAESNFDPEAVSPKNAKGLMQLIPSTARDYGVDDSFDPSSNIEGGVKMLRELMDYFGGNIKLTLAAYNAGKNAVIKYGNNIPPYPETQDYVKRVMKYYSNINSIKIN